MTPRDDELLEHFRAARKMALTLREVKNLTDEQSVGIALRLSGYGPAEIDEYLRDAIEIEYDRRAIAHVVKGIIGVVVELCVLAGFIGTILMVTPGA